MQYARGSAFVPQPRDYGETGRAPQENRRHYAPGSPFVPQPRDYGETGRAPQGNSKAVPPGSAFVPQPRDYGETGGGLQKGSTGGAGPPVERMAFFVKLGIISDIHGNIEALDAVLSLLRTEGVDRILCAGDVVGYGPNPAACIERVVKNDICCVQGNHDEAVAAEGPATHMLPEARRAVEWTKEQLDAEHRRWLRDLPPILDFNGCLVVHASLIPSPPWAYIVDQESALLHFLFQDAPIVFNGHSHVPLLVQHRSGKTPTLDLLRSMFTPRNRRFLIGVGAVGQPRDGDPRAACVIYSQSEHFIELRRIAYDNTKTQEKILHTELPEALALRLLVGR